MAKNFVELNEVFDTYNNSECELLSLCRQLLYGNQFMELASVCKKNLDSISKGRDQNKAGLNPMMKPLLEKMNDFAQVSINRSAKNQGQNT